jgi:hypothetical protein
MKDTLWMRIKFRFYNLKLHIIFNSNENSGKVITTNDNTKAIGKTYLLCKKAIENHVPIITKYACHHRLYHDILWKMIDEIYPDISGFAKKHKVDNLWYDINEIEYTRSSFLVNQEVYIDELLNTEDILMLKEKFGLRIKNGFYYNNLLKSPLETKKKLWWK